MVAGHGDGVMLVALADGGGRCDGFFEKVCSHDPLANLMHLLRLDLR